MSVPAVNFHAHHPGLRAVPDADIQVQACDRHASCNACDGRVAMHLVSRCQQRVRIEDRCFDG